MTPKIGDKFKLLGLVWTVEKYNLGDERFRSYNESGFGQLLWLDLDLADRLDWIKEPATISKAARDEIVEWMRNRDHAHIQAFLLDKLDWMVRDDDNHDN